mgnify:CR=1 FL=1
MAKPILAIMYDFDKTLSTTDMQNYAFIPRLELTPDEFWGKTGEFSSKEGVERILSYMYVMISEAKKKGIKITKEFLRECGKDIKFYPGVLTWFKRIDDFGIDNGVQVEHYLVSSGTKEIVEGCAIYKYFKKVYGCEYLYDENGEAIWPKTAINYTQKTQFYFRIHKGAIDETNDEEINKKLTKNRVPYSNMVYIGDGLTDVAAMTLVKQNGGFSIAVYPPNETGDKQKILYEDERVRAVTKADYSQDSQLEKIIKLLIRQASIDSEIRNKEEKLAPKN